MYTCMSIDAAKQHIHRIFAILPML